jgi:pilus assembly protein CpaB
MIATKRALIAGVAALLGVVAALAVYVYLHDVQQRAYHNAKMATVYVVKTAIPQGTPASTAIASGLVERSQIPLKFRPTNAVTDLASIRGDTAASTLPAGQILVDGLFITPTLAESPAIQAIPKGDVAITISVDQVHEVAGLVQPGAQVDLMVMLSNDTEQFLYQNVAVLAVGSTVAPQPGQATTASSQNSSSNLVTFAVPPQAAERIAYAASGGGGVQGPIYMALVPAGNHASQVPAITPAGLLPPSPTP